MGAAPGRLELCCAVRSSQKARLRVEAMAETHPVEKERCCCCLAETLSPTGPSTVAVTEAAAPEQTERRNSSFAGRREHSGAPKEVGMEERSERIRLADWEAQHWSQHLCSSAMLPPASMVAETAAGYSATKEPLMHEQMQGDWAERTVQQRRVDCSAEKAQQKDAPGQDRTQKDPAPRK